MPDYYDDDVEEDEYIPQVVKDEVKEEPHLQPYDTEGGQGYAMPEQFHEMQQEEYTETEHSYYNHDMVGERPRGVYHDTFGHHDDDVKEEAEDIVMEAEGEVDVGILRSAEALVPDDKGPLPKGWGFGHTESGEMFFIDHDTESTTWVDPRTVSVIRGEYERPADACQYFLLKGFCPLAAECKASHVTKEQLEATPNLRMADVARDGVRDVKDLPHYQTAMSRKAEQKKMESLWGAEELPEGNPAEEGIEVEVESGAWRFGTKKDVMTAGELVSVAQNQMSAENYSKVQQSYLGTKGTVKTDSDENKFFVRTYHEKGGKVFSWHKRDLLVNRPHAEEEFRKGKVHSWKKGVAKRTKDQRAAVVRDVLHGRGDKYRSDPYEQASAGRGRGRGKPYVRPQARPYN